MELNAEQVEKALDWLDSLVGNSNDSDIAMFTYQLLGILYDTCEELTEENERLRTSTVDYRNIPDIIADSKADTVRKMQERFNEKVAKLLISPSIQYLASAFIDQIAKEMLEEG